MSHFTWLGAINNLFYRSEDWTPLGVYYLINRNNSYSVDNSLIEISELVNFIIFCFKCYIR